MPPLSFLLSGEPKPKSEIVKIRKSEVGAERSLIGGSLALCSIVQFAPPVNSYSNRVLTDYRLHCSIDRLLHFVALNRPFLLIVSFSSLPYSDLINLDSIIISLIVSVY